MKGAEGKVTHKEPGRANFNNKGSSGIPLGKFLKIPLKSDMGSVLKSTW
jgi:hypothetical protein